MKYVFDTEAVIEATETIKRFCEHQERCKDCMFNRERRGTSDYCAILNDTPSEWNFRKKKETCVEPTDIPKVGKDIPEHVEIPVFSGLADTIFGDIWDTKTGKR